jgi:hypothetical protein
MMKIILILGVLLQLCVFAESQENEYKGITDPFGDPTQFEFAEEEKEDKEFFHLSRYLMFGLDLGVNIFTGGLGATVQPGFSLGGKVIYFFDRMLTLEVGFHYAYHLDDIRFSNSSFIDIGTTLMSTNLGMRYYFDVRNAPKVIALANPYLAAGGLMVVRGQTLIQNTSGLPATSGSDTSFGAYGGGGVEFPLYKKNIYMGIDVRYNFIVFPDESTIVQSFSRGGDVFSSHVTLTYSF